MVKNGDIISFLRKKEYEMVNNSLGQGAFGKTVLIRDPVIDEEFVAKKYEPAFDDDKEKFYECFKQEIKILYKLNHKNIVRVYNYYTYDEKNTGFIIMENIKGQNIEEYFSAYDDFYKKNKISLDNMFLQLIEAFEYLEMNSICHRDIREGNILIDNAGTVKVIDFGLGKFFLPKIRNDDSRVADINRDGLDRWPDELYDGIYDSKTDMFYLGEMFYRLIKRFKIDGYFSYLSIVEKMREFSPNERFSSFKEIKNMICNRDFSILEISEEDKEIYRSFSNELCNTISCFLDEKTFSTNIQNIEFKLAEVIQHNCFEELIVNIPELISVFIPGTYRYYSRRNVYVYTLKQFYTWFTNLSEESKELVINNLNWKLSQIEIQYSEIPF